VSDLIEMRDAVFALCEATEDECIAKLRELVDGDEVKPENVHAVGFYRGRKSEAKAISRAMADVFRAALTDPQPVSPAVPEGYVLVPREPTEAMLDAYFERMRALGFHAGINASTAWEAMLSAAPAHGEVGG